jgi:hypothetical protein
VKRLSSNRTTKQGEDDVDEIVCHLQGAAEEGPTVGFSALPVRMGVAGLHR